MALPSTQTQQSTTTTEIPSEQSYIPDTLKKYIKSTPKSIPDDYTLFRVSKVEYYPAFTYTCPLCGFNKAVVVKHYVRRAYEQDPSIINTNNLDKIYEPINFPAPYCPSCRVRMQYSYRGDFPVVYVYGRDVLKNKRRKITITDFEPEFYIKEEHKHIIKNLPPAVKGRIKRIEKGYKTYDTYEPLLKLVLYLPTDVYKKANDRTKIALPNLREKFPQTYQADVVFVNKVYDEAMSQFIAIPSNKKTISKSEIIRDISANFQNIPPINYVIYDIETEYGAGIQKAIEGMAQIYSITLYNNYTNAFYVFYNHYDAPSNLQVIQNEIRSKVYVYTTQKYCVQCGDIYEDNYTECPHCHIPLTTLQHENKEFATFLINTPVHIFYSPTERDMLIAFLNLLKRLKPEIMGGHNTSNFDDEVIQKRVNKLIRNPPLVVNHMGIEGIQPFDFMEGWLKTQASQNVPHSLNIVAQKELKTTKYTYDEDIDFLYEHDITTLLAYNLIDVALVVGYNEKIGKE